MSEAMEDDNPSSGASSDNSIMSEAVVDDIQSGASSDSSQGDEGYIADYSADNSDTSQDGDDSADNDGDESGDDNVMNEDVEDEPIHTPSPYPYIVYNLQEDSENLPALQEVLDKSPIQWLKSGDVSHICSFPSDLTLTKQPIKFYNQGLYLFETWMHPDEYIWDFVSDMRATVEEIPMCYTVAKLNLGPIVLGVRITLQRRIYSPNGPMQHKYVLVHYRISSKDDSFESTDDSGQSIVVLDSNSSNEDQTSDEDYSGEGGEEEQDLVHEYAVSTGSLVLAASCGVKVAKQRNRSSSSACRSAAVLDALGVVIDLGPEGIKRCVEESGIGFMMSPIPGNSQSSFPSSSRRSFAYPQNLLLRSGISAPAALPIAFENATPSSITSFNQLIETLIDRVDLSEPETESSLEFILNEANEALISAFLVLLRARRETYEEIVGLARAMMKHSRKVKGLVDAVDIVGTGGAGENIVNTSTGSLVLAASCGVKVAKQRNRSSSSECRSADVLDALGVVIDLGPEGIKRCVEESGIGFMMSPIPGNSQSSFPSSSRRSFAYPQNLLLRSGISVPAALPIAFENAMPSSITSFNQVLKIAEALQRFGMKRALVVHSLGLDEMSP